jgi:hypothetical protein
MKFSVFKFLAVLLALSVMLAMPKSAEAHKVSGTKHQASYQDHSVPKAPASVTGSEISVVSVSSSNDEDDCETGCCSMTAACCSPAALSPQAFEFTRFTAGHVIEIGSQVLPQGPPYTLLRPPKFST